jgi:DEAD/DEAH box helicase domain-containing protein
MEDNQPELQASGMDAESGEGSAMRGNGDASGILSVEALIAHLSAQMHVSQGQQIVHIEPIPARQAEYAVPSPPLAAPLQHALSFMGIEHLYTHQVESLERARRGENIVVVTATSSGKTLCYNLPVIERMLADRDAKAIYIYPINALVNDQLKSLFKINLALGKEAVGVARYTGALSSEKRKAARARNPHIWLTNPEMLHLSFLLWHPNWEDLWRNLRFIVIDEVHSYRGVFGSNMAQLFRRMLRVAAYYGSTPQFICCSATIANPRELAETLTGEKFSVVDHDGAGIGRKYFVLWNPPLQSDDGSNVRRSYAEESVDLLLHCVRANYNAIVFARARRLTERMLRMSRALGEERGESQLLERISSYRAGYLAEEREDIEGKLKAGDIQGIITTNALEMGIDIGGLDAAIISGYPGTMMSTWQQAGRAGRRGRDALVLLVASQNPLDQYYVHHPQEFFARPHELAVVDLDNQYIRLKHLLCSARELPFSSTELAHMLPEPRSLIEEMHQAGLLVLRKREDDAEELIYPQGRLDVHFRVSLRAASQETYHILDEKRNEIGTIELPNVFRETHPGAIYQHGGDDYRVTYLDRPRKIVHVREEHAPHYTRPSSTQALEVSQTYASQTMELGGMPFQVSLGTVLVEETIRSYQELRLDSDELVKKVNLDYPLIIRLHTTAMWLTIPPAMEAQVQAALPPAEQEETTTTGDETLRAPLVEGLHAVQHLVTGMMPLIVMCDQRDVDGFYHVQHPDLQAPAIFVYDAYEGGIGLAEVAYQRVAELLRLAYDTVARCQCLAGCPSCIQSGVCRLRNDALNKAAAITILAELTGRAQHRAQPISALDNATPVTVLPATSLGLTERAASSRKRALEDLLEHTRRKGIEEATVSTEKPVLECKFAKGDWVEQSPYGRGQVLESRIEGQREIVHVRFLRGTVKEVDASKGSLRKGKA